MIRLPCLNYIQFKNEYKKSYFFSKLKKRKRTSLYIFYTWIRINSFFFYNIYLKHCKEGVGKYGLNHCLDQNMICMRRSCRKSMAYVSSVEHLKELLMMKKEGNEEWKEQFETYMLNERFKKCNHCKRIPLDTHLLRVPLKEYNELYSTNIIDKYDIYLCEKCFEEIHLLRKRALLKKFIETIHVSLKSKSF